MSGRKSMVDAAKIFWEEARSSRVLSPQIGCCTQSRAAGPGRPAKPLWACSMGQAEGTGSSGMPEALVPGVSQAADDPGKPGCTSPAAPSGAAVPSGCAGTSRVFQSGDEPGNNLSSGEAFRLELDRALKCEGASREDLAGFRQKRIAGLLIVFGRAT